MREHYNLLNKDETHFSSRDDVCTPMELVDLMVGYIPKELWGRDSVKVLDPSAGNGNFPYVVSEHIKDSSIHAVELSEVRYNIMNNLLPDINTYNQDFFEYSKSKPKFDLVIGNPPYSGIGNKNRNIANKFILESIDLLNDNGYLCFVTPNSWMTFNNNNETLRKLLQEGSFLVIDNDIKKYFPGVGSSFTVFIWQKRLGNKTVVVNNYLVKDKLELYIPKDMLFIPLYLSQEVVDIANKVVVKERNLFDYRCDLHNTTKKHLLRDERDAIFKYRTIHTPSKTRYSNIKQDIYNKHTVIIPLTSYYKPYLVNNSNVTQSVGYISFETEKEALDYICVLNKPTNRVLVHLTRYGNFNNIKLLRHLDFNYEGLTDREKETINKLNTLINY